MRENIKKIETDIRNLEVVRTTIDSTNNLTDIAKKYNLKKVESENIFILSE